jgi:hypothetical protein
MQQIIFSIPLYLAKKIKHKISWTRSTNKLTLLANSWCFVDTLRQKD